MFANTSREHHLQPSKFPIDLRKLIRFRIKPSQTSVKHRVDESVRRRANSNAKIQKSIFLNHYLWPQNTHFQRKILTCLWTPSRVCKKYSSFLTLLLRIRNFTTASLKATELANSRRPCRSAVLVHDFSSRNQSTISVNNVSRHTHEPP